MILPLLFACSQAVAMAVLLAILESSRQRSKYEKILKDLNAACCPGVGLGSIDTERDATILCRGLIVHDAEKHLVSPSQAGSIPATCVHSNLGEHCPGGNYASLNKTPSLNPTMTMSKMSGARGGVNFTLTNLGGVMGTPEHSTETTLAQLALEKTK